MINKSYYIYILSSSKRGTLYIGVTNNLIRRITEHKKEINNGFTSKYHIKDLVYFEQTDNIESALQREKQIKKWNRQWKIELIEANNPKWNDLFSDL
jgi:putative endonuclease